MDIQSIAQILCSTMKFHKKTMNYGYANVLNLSTLSMIYDILEVPEISQTCKLKLQELANDIVIKDKDICNTRTEIFFGEEVFSGENDTISFTTKTNRPPTVDDNSLLFDSGLEEYVFQPSDFLLNFSDPDGDLPQDVRILTLPLTGQLFYNGILIQAGFEFEVSNSNNLVYIREDLEYNINFLFQISDNNIQNKLFSNMATFTINVQGQVNQPPTIGDGSTSTQYNTPKVLTRAMFTSNTTPPYFDPEGDLPLNLRITSLPSTGKLKLNGVDVMVNDVISFATQIDANQLTYVPDPGVTTTQSLDFTFEISDAGSGIFVS